MLVSQNQTSISPSKKKSKAKAKDLTHLSLFTGCGGMDIGIEGGFNIYAEAISNSKWNEYVDEEISKGWVKVKETRFKTVFANDIRSSAKAVYSSFYPDKAEHYKVGSIIDLVKRHWDGETNIFPKNVDILTGGFPCQDFSLAGKRMGFNSKKDHFGEKSEAPTEENRGKLYIWMREVIDIVQPKIFIAENVKGLISLGDAKDIIQKDFETIGEKGYLVLPARVLHAGEFGVPQSRERVFFIGLNKQYLRKEALTALMKNELSPEFSPFPEKTHSLEKNKYVSLKQAFKGLREPHQSKDPSHINYSKCKFYGNHCQGNREVDLNKIGPTIRSEHHGNIEFRRLSGKNGGKNSNELDKGLEQRRLTPRECARIQTFPDNYEFVIDNQNGRVSSSEAYKLIGNAVPPLLAYHLAKRIESLWEKLFKA
ncbi:MAG: DNA (cytosine-5-)-methyltransferase [Bacteriovorax sp.]